MNNDYHYIDPFIDDSQLKDAVAIDNKNNVIPRNEERALKNEPCFVMMDDENVDGAYV